MTDYGEVPPRFKILFVMTVFLAVWSSLIVLLLLGLAYLMA